MAAPQPVFAAQAPGNEPAPSEASAAAPLSPDSAAELTPAQRARLGLDTFGGGNGNGGSVAQPQPTTNGSAATANGNGQAEPRLVPVDGGALLAPTRSIPDPARVKDVLASDDPVRKAAEKPAVRAKKEEISISERDGIPEVERSRAVNNYGVAWTFFCLFFAAVVAAVNASSSADAGPNPSPLVPAVASIALGWVVVFIGRSVKQWPLLTIIPAVVLLLGPFVYATWLYEHTETSARAFLSQSASTTPIDIDENNVLSSTVNTSEGCFALTIDRASDDVRIDAISYAPATAQQQATMALAPRYGRRVPAGGERELQRSFLLSGGKPPVIVTVLAAPTVDCAQAPSP